MRLPQRHRINQTDPPAHVLGKRVFGSIFSVTSQQFGVFRLHRVEAVMFRIVRSHVAPMINSRRFWNRTRFSVSREIPILLDVPWRSLVGGEGVEIERVERLINQLGM